MAVSRAATRIQIDFDVTDRGLVLRASVDGDRREDREFLTEWSRVILEAIAEEISPSFDDGLTTLRLQVVKGPG